jgi:ubiquinone/menaquinone biosynthesis C-methylase UbiE
MASFKQKLLSIYNFPFLSKEQTNNNQKIIRDLEWQAIEPFIKLKGKFLDVGCGAGYAMLKAMENKNCEVFGIDPDPGGHGVGRTGSGYQIPIENIKKAFAEEIPFESKMFDVVYSSHVLEHVNDEQKSLSEMKRVLKDDGLLIIGMPTSDMAKVNLYTQWLLTTHHRFVNFFFSPFIKTSKTKFWMLFAPPSHSYPTTKSVFYDIKYYTIDNWTKIVSKQFSITEILKPAFYPYPEFKQLFKTIKNGKKSSSVFFVCRKN